MNDDIIAHRLTVAGDRWRAAQAEPPLPDVVLLAGGMGAVRPIDDARPAVGVRRPGRHRQHRRFGRSVALATAGVAAAVLVAVGVPQILQRWAAGSGTPATPTSAPPSPAETLTGQLMRDTTGAVYRCANISTIINFPPTLSCAEPRQRVEGVPETAFVYWLPDGHEYSAPATITGAARSDGVFVAAKVTLELAQMGRTLGPPCLRSSTPELSTADRTELRARRVQAAEFIYAHPDRYGASWVAADEALVVIGTTGNLDAARAMFEAVYPKDLLCIYPAKYSYAQLAGYASRFAAGGFYAGIDRVNNRVAVFCRTAAELRLIEQIEPGAFMSLS